MVTEAYEDLQENNTKIDCITKLEMINEIIAFRKIMRKTKYILCCKEKLADRSRNLYLIYKQRQEEENEEQWKTRISDNIDTLITSVSKLNLRGTQILQTERDIFSQ